MLLRFFILSSCVGLMACSGDNASAPEVICQIDDCVGGSGTPAPTATSSALPANAGLSGDLISADYDAGTQTFTVSAVGLNAQMNRFATADFGQMLAMRDVAGVHNAYLGQGAGTKVVIYSGGNAGNVQNLASFGRTSATELPLIGSAQFNGNYAGFTTTRRINGDVQLDVDFLAKTIDGRITNRVFRQRPDNAFDAVNPLSTLVLEATSLGSDGTFNGVTGGGQIVNGQVLWNPAVGSFAGLIGGASGNEAVGTVAVTHHAPNGGSFEEVGGFLASK